ncbi:MAG: intradiol ring-cleavage dioxygenase [Aquabacterium sp.]|uniref:dioxygenase family protein n=1 Tax=Aquabacterium sp. TaxID=1872578 RepID=UPI002724E730|nr:intradiol ring-cleavage dioxygenase [Aquabacterium sp.]MDO9005463.1 intradiol ring-cleavage dioxygenase [Aquabacterium sp.]
MHELHDHDQGLAHDLQTIQHAAARRRQALRWLVGAGTTALLGCGGGGDDADSSSSASGSNTTTSTTTTGSGTTASCSVIPEETAGPYPGDGSNTSNGSIANALALSGIVRSDIRASIAGSTGVAAGVPLTIELRLVNTAASCADLSGYAIYLWHCDRDGKYSMYSSGITDENYLRGVQSTDSGGVVTFTTIFPGCYSGRMPHMHFEIYRSANVATQYSNKLRTSQLAFPVDVCQTVYNGAIGYSASISNLSQISFATDNVFSDGVTLQVASVTGDIVNGYAATLTVGISA